MSSELWYAYCERNLLAVAGSSEIVVVSTMVWYLLNLEAYVEFRYRLHSNNPPPVRFTLLEMWKLILT